MTVPSRRTDSDVTTLVTEESFFVGRWDGGHSKAGTSAVTKRVHTTQVVIHAVTQGTVSLEKKVVFSGTVKGTLKQVTSDEIHPKPVIIMRARGGVRELGMRAQPKQIRTDECVKRAFNLDTEVDKRNESPRALQ